MKHTVEAMCKSHQYNFDLNEKFLEANEEGGYVSIMYQLIILLCRQVQGVCMVFLKFLSQTNHFFAGNIMV